MRHDDILDLVGVDVEAGDDDEILLAVDNTHEAILVDYRDIPGLQPAFAIENFCSGFRALPVALHDLGPLDAELAPGAKGQLLAIVIDHLEQRTRYRQTDSPEARRAAMGVGTGHGRGFGQTIALEHLTSGDALPALGHSGDQSSPTGVGGLQPGEV